MTPENSNAFQSMHGNITSDGTNTGATMFIRHHLNGAPADECRCFNIFVNNNIQGETNSILFGSKVTMRDPGVRLLSRQGWRVKEEVSVAKIRKDANISSSIGFELWIMLALLFVSILSIICKLTS